MIARWTSCWRVCGGSSTAATTRRASRSSVPSGTLATAKKAGKLANLVEELDAAPAAGRRRPPSGTPGGPPTVRPTDVNAHPHCRRRQARRHPQRHRRELRRAQGRARGRRRRRSSPRPTPRWSRTCSRAPTTRRGDLTDGDARGRAPAATAPSRCWPCTRTRPDVVVGARHDSPLVVGLGEGENFLGSDVAAFIAHTREALELGQDQVVTITPDVGHGHRLRRAARRRPAGSPSTGTPPPPRRAASRPSWTRRSTTSRRPSRTPCSAAPTPAGAWSSTRCGSTSRCCGRSTRSSSSPAAPPPTPGTSPSTRSSTGAASRSRSSSRTSSATATRWSTSKTLVVAVSQSGETMDTLMAVRHAREQGAKVLAIVNTHGSTIPRESDAVLYTHAGPGDRGRVDQGVPRPDHRRLPARPVPGPAARQQVPRRDRRDPRPSCARCRTRSSRCSTGAGRVREIARSMVDTTSVLFLGRHVGLPGGDGGRAQAQGARVHPRRGLRGRRAQARADRAHRAGAAGVRHRALAARPRLAALARWSPTSRRSAPAAPARS